MGDHNGGGCRDKNNQCRASWFNNCNDQYWRRQCPKKCGVCSGSHSHNPHSHTPHSHTPHSHSHSGSQQADNQAGGCSFCGTPCPDDCWTAVKNHLDKAIKAGGRRAQEAGWHIERLVASKTECTKFLDKIPSNNGNPRQIYYKTLRTIAGKYLSDQRFNPDGGWLEYGMKKVGRHLYCDVWKCGPMEYATAGSSSDRCPNRSCKSFPNPGPCKLAAPKCKWVPSNGWGSCKDVDQAELLQTTDNTADKTETADTMGTVKRSNELDRLLDDVQIEAKRNVGRRS